MNYNKMIIDFMCTYFTPHEKTYLFRSNLNYIIQFGPYNNKFSSFIV